jgi:acetyl/propionyl-CoA carboxylase alpha subunit
MTETKFKKVLIANRGDIAVRIIRTLRLMNISPISIFAENDKQSLHVRLSDEAFNLGSGTLHDTYMNREKIIDAALWLEADAIHPGYSFLSDDYLFAEEIIKAGLSFIGPSPRVLKKLSGKIETKKIAKKAGFNIIQGSNVPISSLEEAKDICNSFGYPVVIKSVYGGGGLGIRIVQEEKDLEKAIEDVKSQGIFSFTQNDIFIEKYIDPVRNIEFGFIANGYEKLVIFPEIDASLQYQNQKLVAESPCSVLNPEIREEIHGLIEKFVNEVNYDSLGNLEFLYNKGELYFIESNNHIQLEHPLTELLTRIDTIKNQILIAQGDPFTYSQSDLQPNGHALSFRINAEDPLYNFSPTTGTIKELELPGGPGIRFDSNIYRGYTLSPEYDTFIGQLAIHGENRTVAIQRADYALKELSIVGPPTTMLFHRHLIQHPMFKDQDISTSFISNSNIMEKITKEFYAAVAALFSVRKQTSKVILPPLGKSRWRDSTRQSIGV